MPKNVDYCTIALISHASKVMHKILQAKLQQYMNCELLDVQAGFRKGRETRDQIANNHWIIEKAREFQKNFYFCFIDYTKAFDYVDHNKLWKILQEMGIPDGNNAWLFFFFLDSKITADGDCSHEIKTLAAWKKSYDQPRQLIKKQRHYFANKSPSSQFYGFSSSHVWM